MVGVISLGKAVNGEPHPLRTLTLT